MSESQELATVEVTDSLPAEQDEKAIVMLGIEDIRNMVTHVQNVVTEIMKEAPDPWNISGYDYGQIPSVKQKVLFQPGAQKLGLAFQLRPEYDEVIEQKGRHRIYDTKCRLYSRKTNVYMGEGVGTCSTAESKYRYRKNKQTNQREEHPDPADNYNTCRKMAKKRAYVDAIIMTTACSHLFTQDMEETVPRQQAERVRDDTPPRDDDPTHTQEPPPEVYQAPVQTAVDYEAQRPQPHRPPVAQRAEAMHQRSAAQKGGKSAFPIARDGGGYPSEKQIKLCWGKMKGNKVPQEVVHNYLLNQGITNAAGKPSFGAFRDKYQFDDFLAWLEGNPAAENDQSTQQYPPAPSGPAQGMPMEFDDEIPF